MLTVSLLRIPLPGWEQILQKSGIFVRCMIYGLWKLDAMDKLGKIGVSVSPSVSCWGRRMPA
jgi:hypothetical protein